MAFGSTRRLCYFICVYILCYLAYSGECKIEHKRMYSQYGCPIFMDLMMLNICVTNVCSVTIVQNVNKPDLPETETKFTQSE